MDEIEMDALVGLTTEAARKQVEGQGLAFRVVSEDGEGRPATMDYREDRVNAHVEAGKVVKVVTG
jgi:hypothetical protein